MAVELHDALPVAVGEGAEHPHRLLEALGADERREVVVELALDLRAEVEELELLHAAEVGDGHDGIEQRHALVLQQLGVHAPELGLPEARHDEADGVAGGGQEHLRAGLVGLGLDGGSLVVLQPRLLDVVRDVVQPGGEPVVDLGEVAGGVALEAVAGDPVDVVLRAEERADAERALHLLRGERADLRVGIGEAAGAEDRVAVQRAGRGVDLHARLA